MVVSQYLDPAKTGFPIFGQLPESSRGQLLAVQVLVRLVHLLRFKRCHLLTHFRVRDSRDWRKTSGRQVFVVAALNVGTGGAVGPQVCVERLAQFSILDLNLCRVLV